MSNLKWNTNTNYTFWNTIENLKRKSSSIRGLQPFWFAEPFLKSICMVEPLRPMFNKCLILVFFWFYFLRQKVSYSLISFMFFFFLERPRTLWEQPALVIDKGCIGTRYSYLAVVNSKRAIIIWIFYNVLFSYFWLTLDWSLFIGNLLCIICLFAWTGADEVVEMSVRRRRLPSSAWDGSGSGDSQWAHQLISGFPSSSPNNTRLCFSWPRRF